MMMSYFSLNMGNGTGAPVVLNESRSQILQSQTSSLRSSSQGGEYSAISEKGWFD